MIPSSLYRSVVSAAVGILLLPIVACSHRTPQATVEVIDTSMSITPRTEKTVLDAVQGQVGKMQRGDVLVLVPITGDAANDSGGRILRLSAPTQREAYDADLHRFEEQAQRQISSWTASFDRHQSRSDILGALDVAQQEFARLPTKSTRRLIVVSDFLEDDGAYRFISSGELTSQARARQLAVKLREKHGFTMHGAPFCLGRLESSDFTKLSAERKAAVQSFWIAYFAADDALTQIQFDGRDVIANTARGCTWGTQ